jgi:hypothetical protein
LFYSVNRVPSGRRRARRNVQGKSDHLPSVDQCRLVMQLDSWRGGALNNHTWLRRGDLAGLVSVQASQLWDNFRVVIITSGPVDLNSNGSGGYEFRRLSGELHLSPRFDGVGPRPRANGARDVCVSDSLSNSPLCAVAGCVSRGCLPVTGPVRPMVFHDLANQLVVAAKWSTYLTIHRRPPMPPHRNTRPLAGHLRHLQPKRQSAVPKPPGVLSEPPNQPLARQRKPHPASRSLPAPTASLR